jgi:FkbM family methyltransferase
MNLKSLLEGPLFHLPALHAAMLARRPVPDLNKIAWVSAVRRGSTVLDIGANRGIYTEFFARKVGRRGAVYAFEPVQASFDILRERCAVFGNVHPIHAGLSDRAGRVPIYIPGADLQQASLATHAGGSWSQGAEVRREDVDVVTLDEWEAQRQVGRIDFIKLDAEGAEYRILRGARATLKRHQPLIYMEVCRDWVREFGIEPEELAAELRDLGYRHACQPVLEGRRLKLVPVDFCDLVVADVFVSCRPL